MSEPVIRKIPTYVTADRDELAAAEAEALDWARLIYPGVNSVAEMWQRAAADLEARLNATQEDQ